MTIYNKLTIKKIKQMENTKIEKTITYSFEIREKDFKYSIDGTPENSLIALCLTNTMIEDFELRLKAKQKKTPKDKHDLTCIKSTGYVLRQFIAGCLQDVLRNQKKETEMPIEVAEVIEEPISNPAI